MIMVSKDKAYIVANEQQEREVLTKLEQEGYVWYGGEKPTEWIPSKNFNTDESFPIAITSVLGKHLTLHGRYEYFNDEQYDIVYDGREEEAVNHKTKISESVLDELSEWRNDTFSEWDSFVSIDSLDELPESAKNWWADEDITDKERNNRLILIILWVNGKDLFEVEKNKWVVRSKVPEDDGYYWYVSFTSISSDFCVADNEIMVDGATRFETKQEAESWANAHQEVIEVDK